MMNFNLESRWGMCSKIMLMVMMMWRRVKIKRRKRRTRRRKDLEMSRIQRIRVGRVTRLGFLVGTG